MEPSTPIRVGFDVSSAAGRRPRGIAGYIRALLPALERAAPWIEPVLFLRDERWFRSSRVADLLPSAERRWILEPLMGRIRDLDVFHGMGTRLPRSDRVRRSFTLHDLREYEIGSRANSNSTPDMDSRKARTIQRASGIVCLTEYGKGRLQLRFPQVNPGHVAVIGNGVDLERFRQRDVAERQKHITRFGLDAPFFLQLGSFFPHKNLELSLRAFARTRAAKEGHRLVLAGGGGSEQHRTRLREISASLEIGDRVAWIDDLSSEALPFFLSSARGLLMPSRYEGFGLPILEAMASGVPGVCSNAACLPEVAGGIWDTSDPDDVESFAAAIDRLAFDDEVHAEQVARGLERAQQFTWDACAARTAAFLGQVARGMEPT